MTIWFTADLHLGHDMVAKYRGFKSAHKHDKALISNYNGLVKDDDTVYVVGDLCMWGTRNKERVEEIVRKLKGQKHLILGNHDKLKPFDYVEMGIISVHTALEPTWHMANYVRSSSELWKPVLVHDPSAAATDINRAWVCGHIHSLFKRVGRVLNVGVDVWDLKPVSIVDVYRYLRHACCTDEQKKMSELAGSMRHDEETRKRLHGVEIEVFEIPPDDEPVLILDATDDEDTILPVGENPVAPSRGELDKIMRDFDDEPPEPPV